MKSKLQSGLKGQSPGTELRTGHGVVKIGGEPKEGAAAAWVGILWGSVGFVVMKYKHKISNAAETDSEIPGTSLDGKVSKDIIFPPTPAWSSQYQSSFGYISVGRVRAL